MANSWGRGYAERVYTSCPREADIEGFVWDGKGCKECARWSECSQVYPIMSRAEMAHAQMIEDRLNGD